MEIILWVIAANAGVLVLVMFLMWFSSRLTHRVKVTLGDDK